MAFRLFLAVAVVAFVSVVISFAAMPAAIEIGIAEQRAQATGLTPEQLELVATATRIGVITVAVLTLVVICLLVLFTFKMRAGRNWARITLTVVGGIGAVFYGLSLLAVGVAFAAGGVSIVGALVSILTVVLLIAAIVFMYRPDATPYFSARR